MKTNLHEKIVILGASDKPHRYSHKAMQMLLEYGFTNLVGVSPKSLNLPIEKVSSLAELSSDVHTLTLYVGDSRLEPMIDAILKLSPKRIIANPGTENPRLLRLAQQQGIEVIRGCTLVMLSIGEF